MTRSIPTVLLLLAGSGTSSAFSTPALPRTAAAGGQVRTFSQEPGNEGEGSSEENQGLVLEGLGTEMAKMSSEYSFTESDFLAAARKRAEMKVESSTAGASDDEWKEIATEKKEQFGEIDDWVNSKKEAGNVDSQILMFTDGPAEDSEGEDDGEQKLLLF